jgi:uncharacterized membrane protein
MKLSRALRHLLLPDWWTQRTYSPAPTWRRSARRSRRAKGASRRAALRRRGRAALGFAVARPKFARAPIELFASQRVWDTEENSGILIYVQLLDRRVEILADRGIAARVPQAEWDAICRAMEGSFRGGGWRSGALRAVARAGNY